MPIRSVSDDITTARMLIIDALESPRKTGFLPRLISAQLPRRGNKPRRHSHADGCDPAGARILRSFAGSAGVIRLVRRFSGNLPSGFGFSGGSYSLGSPVVRRFHNSHYYV
jgi:hypothetical protein